MRIAVVGLALLLSACGTPAADRRAAPEPTTASASPTAPASPSPPRTPTPRPHASDRPVLGTQPPTWLGTRVLRRRPDGLGVVRRTPPELVQRRFTLPDRLPPLPGTGFASRVTTPAPAGVIARSTWEPGCPVTKDDLSWVQVTFRGFESGRHTGELLVNTSAAADLVQVFHRLWDARFPLEELRITTRRERDAPPTGDGNGTGAFVCRAAVGTTTYSQHAYGLAVDVNPFQNPYSRGDLVIPELASSYVDRGWLRPGMITPDGPVVRAFASIGWTWGGTWHSSKDRQHFSANGQ